MSKPICRLMIVLALGWAGSVSSQAPITDTVIADGKEWAQPILFANLSWNQINDVCSGGPCVGGSRMLNGHDMTGWTWASFSDVDEVYNSYGVSPAITVDVNLVSELDSTWAPAFFAGGWRAVTGTSVRGRTRQILDIPELQLYHGGASFITDSAPGGLDEITPHHMASLNDAGEVHIGAWFYRPIDDTDSDMICDKNVDITGVCIAGPAGGDNCPLDKNPSQTDIDGDLAGDICDVCPADSSNLCSPAGSAAAEVTSAGGGTVATPNDPDDPLHELRPSLELVIEAGDLVEDTTISITQEDGKNPAVNLIIGTNSGEGQAIAFYDLEPDGLQFAGTITMNLVVNVTALNSGQRSKLDVYRFEDTNGDGTEDKFVSLGAVCTVDETPPGTGTFIATCEVQVDHFSDFAIVFPRDTDNDQVMDEFNGEVDNCRAKSNPLQEDANKDGCGDACIKAGCGGPFCSNP